MKKLLFIILILLWALPGWGATETFYVCQGGDGTLPETAVCATAWDDVDIDTAGNWAAIDADDAKIGPNDDVLFMDEGGDILFTVLWDIKQSGLSGLPITFKNAPGDTPVLDANGQNAAIYSQDKSYLTFDGLTMKGGEVNAFQSRAATAQAVGITVENCTLDGTASSNASSNVLYMFDSNGHDTIVISNNTIFGAGADSGGNNSDNIKITTGSNIDIYGNTLYNANAEGLDLADITDLNVYNNFLYDNNVAAQVGQSDVKIHSSAAPDTSQDVALYNNIISSSHNGHGISFVDVLTNIYMYNNTVYGIAGSQVYVVTSSTITAKNNVVYNGAGDDIEIDGTSTVNGDYNWFEDAAEAGAGTYTDGGNTTWSGANPLFANAAGNNFRLQPNSPLIDAGTTLDIHVQGWLDYGDSERGCGEAFDIGAYEFCYSSDWPPLPIVFDKGNKVVAFYVPPADDLYYGADQITYGADTIEYGN